MEGFPWIYVVYTELKDLDIPCLGTIYGSFCCQLHMKDIRHITPLSHHYPLILRENTAKYCSDMTRSKDMVLVTMEMDVEIIHAAMATERKQLQVLRGKTTNCHCYFFAP